MRGAHATATTGAAQRTGARRSSGCKARPARACPTAAENISRASTRQAPKGAHGMLHPHRTHLFRALRRRVFPAPLAAEATASAQQTTANAKASSRTRTCTRRQPREREVNLYAAHTHHGTSPGGQPLSKRLDKHRRRQRRTPQAHLSRRPGLVVVPIRPPGCRSVRQDNQRRRASQQSKNVPRVYALRIGGASHGESADATRTCSCPTEGSGPAAGAVRRNPGKTAQKF